MTAGVLPKSNEEMLSVFLWEVLSSCFLSKGKNNSTEQNSTNSDQDIIESQSNTSEDEGDEGAEYYDDFGDETINNDENTTE